MIDFEFGSGAGLGPGTPEGAIESSTTYPIPTFVNSFKCVLFIKSIVSVGFPLFVTTSIPGLAILVF